MHGNPAGGWGRSPAMTCKGWIFRSLSVDRATASPVFMVKPTLFRAFSGTPSGINWISSNFISIMPLAVPFRLQLLDHRFQAWKQPGSLEASDPPSAGLFGHTEERCGRPRHTICPSTIATPDRPTSFRQAVGEPDHTLTRVLVPVEPGYPVFVRIKHHGSSTKIISVLKPRYPPKRANVSHRRTRNGAGPSLNHQMNRLSSSSMTCGSPGTIKFCFPPQKRFPVQQYWQRTGYPGAETRSQPADRYTSVPHR